MAETINLGVVGIKNMGAFDANTNYEKLNVVTYQGSSYCALRDTIGNLPTDTDYWQLYAEKGDIGDAGPRGPEGPRGLKGDPGGSPLVVSSISEMIDTSSVYVNTTDGNWYYYDGNNWEIGGTYQATSIANGSIDLLKLDTLLQENYISSYEEITLAPEISGKYLSISNNELVFVNQDDWKYSVIDLEEGEEYFITGKMFTVNAKTYVITNGDDVVDYTPTGTAETFNSIVYKANANDKLYTCHRNTYIGEILVYKITDININKQKNEFTLEPMAIRNERYVEMNNKDIGSVVNRLLSSENYNTKIYRLEKGKKYSFSASGYYSISGLVVTDLNNVIKYYVPRSIHAIQTIDTFVASEDGYAYICNGVTSTTVNGKISLYDELIKNKNWYAIGDSITEVNFRALHNYLYWISQDIPELNIINKGISGTGYKNGSNTFIQRLDSINSYNMDTDIITVMGSINDMQHVTNSLGELGDTTTDTVYGAMYTFFNTLFTKFNGVRVGCISPINWKGSKNSNALPLYIKALKETCELFNVPFLDMTINTNLRPDDNNFLNTYYLADGTGNTGQIDAGGVHPNSNGHKLLYGRIKEFINTL